MCARARKTEHARTHALICHAGVWQASDHSPAKASLWQAASEVPAAICKSATKLLGHSRRCLSNMSGYVNNISQLSLKTKRGSLDGGPMHANIYCQPSSQAGELPKRAEYRIQVSCSSPRAQGASAIKACEVVTADRLLRSVVKNCRHAGYVACAGVLTSACVVYPQPECCTPISADHFGMAALPLHHAWLCLQ